MNETFFPAFSSSEALVKLSSKSVTAKRICRFLLSWLNSNEDLKYHASESTALWKYYDYFGSYCQTDPDKEDLLVWKRLLKRMYDFCMQA